MEVPGDFTVILLTSISLGTAALGTAWAVGEFQAGERERAGLIALVFGLLSGLAAVLAVDLM